MANVKHIKNLPKIPQAVIDAMLHSIDLGEGVQEYYEGIYKWIPGNDSVQQWCRDNISRDIFWGIQVIGQDLPIHKDHGTLCKFTYIISGDKCVTHFYDDDETLIESATLEHGEWYILNTNVNHDVTGVENTRITLTGRICP